MQTRHAALRELEHLLGIHEQGGNNRGAWVEAIQRSDTLTTPDTVYSWCVSTQQAAWRLATGGRWVNRDGSPWHGTIGGARAPWKVAGGELLAGGTASVWQLSSWADSRGYDVRRPFKGDLVCFDFHLRGGLPADHIAMVRRVVSIRQGGIYIVDTIEGNTGPVGALDTGDANTGADGVYVKRRVIRPHEDCRVYRVPGKVAA